MSGSDREATVMIVDDVPDNLMLLSAILRKENYRVEVFTDGASALEGVAQNKPDIILLDISMPEMDGYQVCQTLKSNDQFDDIPIIFISALAQTEEKVKGFEVGGQDYITKPFEVREVKERVRTHLELAWTRKELEETLDQTLTGSMKLISDFLGFVNPTAFSRGIRIKQNMAAMVERLDLEPKRWFELAAMLSQFGLAAVPPALQEKYSQRKTLTSVEKEEIEESIDFIANMVKSIPRLELVSEMITNHKLTLKVTGNKQFEDLEIGEQGGMILNLLWQYDQLPGKEKLTDRNIEMLQKDYSFPEILFDVLISIDEDPEDQETRCCPIDKLATGMTLQEDVVDVDGRTLLKRGVKLSDTFIKAILFQRNRLPKNTLMIKLASEPNPA